MDVYGEILRGTALPRFFPLRQRFDRAEVPDAGEAVRRTLGEAGVLERLRPGDTVALTAGSRQIDRLPEILRALAEAVRSRGALPFLVPAMGSHGGATAEGQRALLARYDACFGTEPHEQASVDEFVALRPASSRPYAAMYAS